jgi:hypothetical protein
MFNWLQKIKKQDSNKPLSHLPAFLVEVDSNGNVMISASWPRPTSHDELAHIVKAYTGLLMLLEEGKLVPVFQHAISIYGENHDDIATTKAILLTAHNFIKHQQEPQPNTQRPLVAPTEAFRRG